MYGKNAWAKYAGDTKPVMDFAEGYKAYISNGKTERLAVKEIIKKEELAFIKTLANGEKLLDCVFSFNLGSLNINIYYAWWLILMLLLVVLTFLGYGLYKLTNIKIKKQ